MTEAADSSILQPADPAAALGEVLRQARSRKGFSIGEVAERLKLSARQVEALEQGVYHGLPEPVFVRGFLRSYARLLGLDEAVLEAQIQAVFPSEPVVKPAALGNGRSGLDYRDTPVRKPFPKWLFGLLLLAAIGGAIYAWQNKSSTDNARQNAAGTSLPVGQVAMPNVEASNVSVVPMGSDAAVSQPSASAPLPAAASAAGGNQVLLIVPRYRSVLHVVNARGEVLVSKVVAAGSENRFENGAPYQVRIGYASGAKVSLDGVDVPLEGHIQNRTAQLTVGGQ